MTIYHPQLGDAYFCGGECGIKWLLEVDGGMDLPEPPQPEPVTDAALPFHVTTEDTSDAWKTAILPQDENGNVILKRRQGVQP